WSRSTVRPSLPIIWSVMGKASIMSRTTAAAFRWTTGSANSGPGDFSASSQASGWARITSPFSRPMKRRPRSSKPMCFHRASSIRNPSPGTRLDPSWSTPVYR
ncbi:MAG: hypothetical protein AVDCRST_MAG93-6494, partial [uncultured Chloroflexia bacterium]